MLPLVLKFLGDRLKEPSSMASLAPVAAIGGLVAGDPTMMDSSTEMIALGGAAALSAGGALKPDKPEEGKENGKQSTEATGTANPPVPRGCPNCGSTFYSTD